MQFEAKVCCVSDLMISMFNITGMIDIDTQRRLG